MGDNDNPDRLAGMNRRKFLAGIGAGAAASVAGCTTGQPASPTPREVTKTVRVTDTPTATPRSSVGDHDSYRFNAMGYTGADEFIDAAAAKMAPEARQPIIKKALAQIWHDAPTDITWEDKVLQPVNNNWEGYVQTVGGVLNTDTWLNIRQKSGSGGRPIEALDTLLDSLNPLVASSSYEFEVLDKIYGYGTTFHPETLAFLPWQVDSWELNVDNVGTSSPTVVAQLRDDLTFNDGEKVTAEDVKFTVDYIQEQEPSGSIAASIYSSVEEVAVDDPAGTTVNYFFSQKDAQWLTGVVGGIILPKHIWSGQSDYTKYEPRKSSEGIVGSGPFVLSDFNFENWFELDLRPSDELWQNTAESATWLSDDGPFIDGVRVEIFGTETAMREAVINEDAVVTFGSWPVPRAVDAKRTDYLDVLESPDDGFQHHSFNLRRVPLDDVAFRQFLVKTLDSTWMVEELFEGIGAVEGTYATPTTYQQWRPPEPTEIDEFEGISVPALAFPGSAGNFNGGVKAARNFLLNHSEAKHDYTLGEAVTDVSRASDQKEIYVNGEPLSEAHTDNFGEPGQGPLQMSFNPPQKGVEEARLAQTWAGYLNTVGVPVETQVQSFNSQLPKVYVSEDFDMFAMGWSLGVDNTHYQQLYGTPGADLGY